MQNLLITVYIQTTKQKSMRAHKMPSVSEKCSPTLQKKYYSIEEVGQIIKMSVSSKISKLQQELEDRHLAIKALNEKLHFNEKLIQQQRQTIQKMQNHHQHQHYENTLQLINTVLNDKISHLWSSVQNQVEGIRKNAGQCYNVMSSEVEGKVQRSLCSLKNLVSESIDTLKKKNNAYWLKVKEALNKMNARIQTLDERLNKIGRFAQQCMEERKKYCEANKEIKQSEKVIKNFLELKQSVANLYKSYKQVLQSQNYFRKSFEQTSTPFSEYTPKLEHRKIGQAEPEIVILQYSKQEDTQSIPYKESKLNSEYYSREKKQKEMNTLSPIKSGILSHKALHQSCTTSQPELGFSSDFMNNDLYSHTINLSIEARKEMVENSKERFKELVQVKCLTKPVRVYLDRINYLKNEDGNYIFDTKGNMFKFDKSDFISLQREGLITNISSSIL